MLELAGIETLGKLTWLTGLELAWLKLAGIKSLWELAWLKLTGLARLELAWLKLTGLARLELARPRLPRLGLCGWLRILSGLPLLLSGRQQDARNQRQANQARCHHAKPNQCSNPARSATQNKTRVLNDSALS